MKDFQYRMNVVGVGTNVKGDEDTGDPVVKVLVSQKLPLSDLPQDDLIPARVGRYETDVGTRFSSLALMRVEGTPQM